jgi:flavodoxin
MKILVVYYSRTGHTATVAKAIAQNLNCELEEIHDTKNRQGIFRWLMAGRDGMSKKFTTISKIKNDSQNYDLVIIGTPIWVNTTPAIRTYLHQNANKLKRVAYFCTMDGTKSEDLFADMQAESGREPIATLAIRANDVTRDNYQQKLQRFINQITKQ